MFLFFQLQFKQIFLLKDADNQQVLFVSDAEGNEYFGYWCRVDTSVIDFSYGDGNGHSSNNRRSIYVNTLDLDLNTWYNLAIVVRGPTNMSLYLDGVELTNVIYSGTGGNVQFTSSPFHIARYRSFLGNTKWDWISI